MTSLPSLLQQTAPYLQEYGLWAVFIALFLETFGLPVPGETLLIAASLLVAQGQFHYLELFGIGALAAVLGDNLAFYVGRFSGRKLLLHHGPKVGLTHERFGKMHRFYERFGAEVVIVARFYVIARQLNGLVAGASDMAPLRFFIYNVFGAVLWVGTWSTAGWFLGNHLAALLDWVVHAAPLAIGAAAIVAGIAYLYYKRFRANANVVKVIEAVAESESE